MTPRLQVWQKEPESRLQGSRGLDSSKVQAPGIVRLPDGRFRLFYTAVGPERPFRACQGYLLSAVSDDGLLFHPEPGIRLAPRADLRHMSLRVIAPSVVRCGENRWRMYFEARGPADCPTVICSALSRDLLNWKLEDGIRLQGFNGVGGPRFLPLPDGTGRLSCFASQNDGALANGGRRVSQSIISARTTDGLQFEIEPGHRIRDRQADYDTAGVSAAEVVAPEGPGDEWIMFYSAWQDVPPGSTVPVHPSQDPNAVANGLSEDFAAASIASDMAGYRSRICRATSRDGLLWHRDGCVIEGGGYAADGVDAVHAEDMALIRIGPARYRMYYAACDRHGRWCIASAVSSPAPFHGSPE